MRKVSDAPPPPCLKSYKALAASIWGESRKHVFLPVIAGSNFPLLLISFHFVSCGHILLSNLYSPELLF